MSKKGSPVKAYDIFLTGDGGSSLYNVASRTETGLGCSGPAIPGSGVDLSPI